MLRIVVLAILCAWCWDSGQAAVLFQSGDERAVLITALTDFKLGPDETNSTATAQVVGVAKVGTSFLPAEDLVLDTAKTRPSTKIPIMTSAILRKTESTRNYLYSTESGILIRAHSSLGAAVDEETDNPAGFKLTTEKLAYILIGSCCGLSILCLVVVAASLRCREHYQTRLVEKKWPTRLYDTPAPSFVPVSPLPYHFTFARRAPVRKSECESCQCTCGTWSLGPSNLGTSTMPLFGTGKRKVFSHRLPFGTASALHFSTPTLNTSRPSYNYSVPRSCHCQKNYASRGDNYKTEETTSTTSSAATSSSSSYDPDYHPHCTCIEPPRRLMEWDVSPDSLNTSEDTEGPSWQACSYLVDTMHRHHRNPSAGNRHSAQTSKSTPSWNHFTGTPQRNPSTSAQAASSVGNGTARGVSWTSNSERLI